MKPKTFRVLILVLFVGLMIPAFSQTSPLSTKSKKAAALFTEAINYYDQKDYQKAIRILDKATEEDSAFVEAYILKGDIISEQRSHEKLLCSIKKALMPILNFLPVLYFIVANVEL